MVSNGEVAASRSSRRIDAAQTSHWPGLRDTCSRARTSFRQAPRWNLPSESPVSPQCSGRAPSLCLAGDGDRAAPRGRSRVPGCQGLADVGDGPQTLTHPVATQDTKRERRHVQVRVRQWHLMPLFDGPHLAKLRLRSLPPPRHRGQRRTTTAPLPTPQPEYSPFAKALEPREEAPPHAAAS